MRYSHEPAVINHPDHLAVGEATLAAVFPLARDFLTFPEQGTPHNVKDVFLYNFEKANYHVDIVDTIEKKIELLNLHASQYKKEETESLVKDWNHSIGQKFNLEYAESFVHLVAD
jgi:LmbE family N-acetylglucosaminyl deacetylase